MANCYYKFLNNKINSEYREQLMSELQDDIKKSVNADSADVYSMIKSLNSIKPQELDMSLLLKCYMLNQILNSSNIKHVINEFTDTKNPNIKTDKNGKYYRIITGKIERDDSIIAVNDAGSYTKQEKRHGNSFSINKTYDINDQLISINVTNHAGKFQSNPVIVAEILGLKQEYKKKFKYSGYSGNSRDMVATICNLFFSPVETGYYVDFHCICYKWQYSTSSFIRVFGRECDSPLLVDIEFLENGTVLRQEYTGIAA